MKQKRILLPLVALCLLAVASCHKEKHFITDSEYRAQVHQDFLQRKQLAEGLTGAFDGMDTLDTETREALEFLYAYMPYSDLADYDQAFYLQQVRAAFKARDEFSWGSKVPEDIFRHFVLVYRVNNENLDTARLLMQRELKPRVEGLSMYDAALEVNHWCHEYVAYRASDGRTSAPLATMRTSLGRCGEESTFTVTALRSVGIPARHCYTPRWAHCDDNHAWVEVFIADSNRWYFLGACEPDPELDMGWFAVPSTRCMMVHSKAFGRYKGDEEVVKQTALYSELNLLSHYAPTKKVTVKVYDNTNKPVEGAAVKFKLYNYSEFYPLATIKTDKEGTTSLTTGLGDLQIWATDGKHYNYVKLDVRKQTETEIYLTREGDAEYNEETDIVPPVAGEAKVTPSEEKNRINEQRKAREDSIREAYVATFPTEENYKNLLKPSNNLTDEEAWEIIHKAEGNYEEIAKFLNNHAEEDLCEKWSITCLCNLGHLEEYTQHSLYDYLKTFSDKDMRDITAETLEAHWCKPSVPAIMETYDAIYVKGLMPARISNEMVRPWRQFLAEKLADIKDANSLIAWTKENIVTDDTGNYYNCPISPRGVYELRHSDRHSRDIFFVAACRSLGIPAYLDNATNTIYVNDGDAEKLWKGGKWHAVTFEKQEAVQPTAKLTLTYKPTKELAKPVYWPHFTLAKYKDGDFVTFDFEDDPRMDKFPATIDLEPGYYCLMTGNRYPEGDVLVKAEYFTVSDNQKVTKEIILRPLVERTSGVLATIDPNQEIIADMATLADYAGDAGMLFVFLGDYKEPSKHLVKEMQALRDEYKAWGGMIYLVAPAAALPLSWKLPNTDCILREPSQKDPFETQLTGALKLDLKNDYPLVALVNKRGEISYHSHGYSIGLAEQILKRTKK
ncbi:MAG: transglutaminase domain-containing protein [Bacteroidales bacterium]|nr:transglutaminase domain-containing protein [Bacteroidales bacterium]